MIVILRDNDRRKEGRWCFKWLTAWKQGRRPERSQRHRDIGYLMQVGFVAGRASHMGLRGGIREKGIEVD
jgi:hypothetical protein